MNDMIERVAMAILVRSRSVMSGPNYPTPDDCWHIARAVIEAIDEPTPRDEE